MQCFIPCRFLDVANTMLEITDFCPKLRFFSILITDFSFQRLAALVLILIKVIHKWSSKLCIVNMKTLQNAHSWSATSKEDGENYNFGGNVCPIPMFGMCLLQEIGSLGEILEMTQGAVLVEGAKAERFFLVFHQCFIILSPTSEMNGFIFLVRRQHASNPNGPRLPLITSPRTYMYNWGRKAHHFDGIS